MRYCDNCASRNEWPNETWEGRGNCQVCGEENVLLYNYSLTHEQLSRYPLIQERNECLKTLIELDHAWGDSKIVMQQGCVHHMGIKTVIEGKELE